MSDIYLFPCDCGNEINVEAGDAGTEIECEQCQKVSTLPGLRELKKLKVATADSVGVPAGKKWTHEKGVWFSVGIGIFLIAFVCAAIFAYISKYKYPIQEINLRGDWISADERKPDDIPVWAYSPEPGDRKSYEITKWDPDQNAWIFQNGDPPVPEGHFSKWGDSYQTSAEADVNNRDLRGLWGFWYEKIKVEPLPEWLEPPNAINRRFASMYMFFAMIAGGVALAGAAMAVFGILKK